MKSKRKKRIKKEAPHTASYHNSLRYYNYSSAAVEVMPEYVPASRPERSPVQKSRSRMTTYHRFMLMFNTALFFAGAFILMVSFSNIRSMDSTKKALDSSLVKLRQENDVLKSQIINETDLDYIRTYAQQNLGMDKPASYQVKTVKIKKTSYTELFDDKKYSVKQNSFLVEAQSFIDYLSKLFKGVIDSA